MNRIIEKTQVVLSSESDFKVFGGAGVAVREAGGRMVFLWIVRKTLAQEKPGKDNFFILLGTL